MTDRAEHVRWCKQRAMELLNAGDHQQAVTSMLSDLGKHSETAGMLEWAGMMGLMSMQSSQEAKRFIEGFAE